MSSSRTESSQNAHERVHKGWELKLLTRPKCGQEMLVHARSEKRNSVIALCSASGLYPRFIRHSSEHTGGLGFFHLFWTNATSINKDSGPRLSFVPLRLDPPHVDFILITHPPNSF